MGVRKPDLSYLLDTHVWIWSQLAPENQALDLRTIELSHAHSIESYSLPPEFHKDPADRMLAATARVEGLTLITADQRILDYDHVQAYDARL